MDKRKITLTVIAVAVLLVVLVGSTYAYWTLNGTPSTSANASIQTGGLILRLDDVNGITSKDVIDPNNLSFSKYFSITNESNADGYAKILFKGLTNTFVSDALVYDLEEVQSDKTSYATPRMIITNEVVPKSAVASNQVLADGLLIEKGTLSGNTVTPNTKYYKVTVRYKYSDTVDQSEDVGATLVSGFTIEEGQSSVSMTVSFNTNDNTVSTPANQTVTFGGTYENLPTLSKTGYTAEWYTDSLLTEKVTSTSNVTKVKNHTLYAKWIEKKTIACIDASGNEIACPSTWTQGDRIAIGEGTNKQYFRYLRTTSTSAQLAECGGAGITGDNGNENSSKACADATNGDLRFLAEYNLKRTGDATSSTAIASDALQDPSDSATTNAVQYGPSNSDYNQSWVKTYMANYQSVLNTMIGETDAIKVNLMTYPEIKSLGWGCPASSTGRCSSIPSWAMNSYYWLGSAYNTNDVWLVDNIGRLININYDYGDLNGARAVVTISASYFE